MQAKKIATCLTVAATLLCSFSIASANVVANERDPFSFLFFNACTGEDVLVEGMFHRVVREKIGDDGSVSIDERINANGTGLGLSSGAEYVWNDSFTFEIDDIPEVSFTVRQTGFVRLIGKGRTPNELMQADFLLRFDSNGVFFESIENVACRPK